MTSDMRKLMETANKLYEDDEYYLGDLWDEMYDDLSVQTLFGLANEYIRKGVPIEKIMANLDEYEEEASCELQDDDEVEAFEWALRQANEEDLDESPLRRDDPAWDEYNLDQEEEAQDMKDAPYYVAWAAQSWEWYGDGDPGKGQGRYKGKGDGGRIVAINVPTHAQAQKIADQLDLDYEEGNFEDKNVYGRHGDSGYYLEYHGAFVNSMSKMDEYDKEHLQHVHPRFAPKDYSE